MTGVDPELIEQKILNGEPLTPEEKAYAGFEEDDDED